MSKNKYYTLNLTLEHESEGLTKEQDSDLFMEIIEVIDKYNLSCMGLLKPVTEDEMEIAKAETFIETFDRKL